MGLEEGFERSGPRRVQLRLVAALIQDHIFQSAIGSGTSRPKRLGTTTADSRSISKATTDEYCCT